MTSNNEPIIDIKNLKTFLGGAWVHNGINLTIYRNEIFAIVGTTGSGKTTLLRCILNLQEPNSGTIKLFGKNIFECTEHELHQLQHRFGVMFQNGALFSSLTLLENVEFPLKEFSDKKPKQRKETALNKLESVGLTKESAAKFPSQLSGGMQKRGSAARAIVMDPELLFLDEPTSSLDPEGANSMDELIYHLKKKLNLTVIMVTHDLNSLWRIVDRVAFIGDGKILDVGTVKELSQSKIPLIQKYFNSPRGKAAEHTEEIDHGNE